MLHLALAWDDRIIDQDLILISCPNLHFPITICCVSALWVWDLTNSQLKAQIIKSPAFLSFLQNIEQKKTTLHPDPSPHTFIHWTMSAPHKIGMSTTELLISYLEETLAIAFPLVIHNYEMGEGESVSLSQKEKNRTKGVVEA